MSRASLWSIREPMARSRIRRVGLECIPCRRVLISSRWCRWRLRPGFPDPAFFAQFPRINTGVKKARSAEEDIQGVGFNVTLNPPLFNRSRGSIGVGRARRAYLFQSYQTSLNERSRQADQVWIGVENMRGQLKTLAARLCGFERAAVAAKESLERGIVAYPGH